MLKNKHRIYLALACCVLLVSAVLFRTEPAPQPNSWQETDKGMIYADEQGQLVTGWTEIEGKHYYFDQDHLLVTGWLDLEGQRYYMGSDGARTTGWQEIDGKNYYFDDNGIMLTGLQDVDGLLRLFDENGAAVSGWQETEHGIQYFDEYGVQINGFLHLDTGTYYLNEAGYLHTGHLNTEEGTYFFRSDGTMVTGWFNMGEYDYYFLPDGTMATSTQVIDGEKHFFAPGGQHVLLVNPWNFLPRDLNPDLEALDNGHLVDLSCYTALTEMLAACQEAGFKPYVCSGYRTQAKQVSLLENKVQKLMEEGYSQKEAESLARNTVAFPGTSEHQLGLAVDIISEESQVLDYNQAKTETQKWFMENCWEYGFILRYPENATHITGIIYEPWHYRYVGREIALEIRELGITLEEYLGAVSTEPLPEIEAVG